MNMAIGDKIMYQRKLKRIKQADLADKIGVSLRTLQRWELGKYFPNTEDISKIAQVLNVPVSELMDTPELEKTPQIQVIPSQNKTSQSQEINTGMAMITLQDGRKFEAPATPEGYAFLTNLFNISENRAATS